jgi:flagellar basal body P-ring formation protein FlgA
MIRSVFLDQSRVRCWLTAALGPALTLASPVASPLAASTTTSPAEIDRAITQFTGALPGEPGGARAPADPRLRLAACAAPLALDWHTAQRSSVKVECTAGPSPWRIFVAVMPPAAQGFADRAGAPAVKRGDAVTIMVRGRGFSVQQPGEASEAGAVGEWIFVRTARKAEPLRARIERPGLVVIPKD